MCSRAQPCRCSSSGSMAVSQSTSWPSCRSMSRPRGLTAEKLLPETKFPPEDMDKWAMKSHHMAAKALQEGYFKGEIMPVEAPQADGTKKIIDSDLAIRADTSMEALAPLKAFFQP